MLVESGDLPSCRRTTESDILWASCSGIFSSLNARLHEPLQRIACTLPRRRKYACVYAEIPGKICKRYNSRSILPCKYGTWHRYTLRRVSLEYKHNTERIKKKERPPKVQPSGADITLQRQFAASTRHTSLPALQRSRPFSSTSPPGLVVSAPFRGPAAGLVPYRLWSLRRHWMCFAPVGEPSGSSLIECDLDS